MHPIYTIRVIYPCLIFKLTPHSIPVFLPLIAQLHKINVSSTSIYSYDAMQLSEADVNSLHDDATPSYETWLVQWTKHLVGLSETVVVPSVAATVTTPLNINGWQARLMGYPNRLLVTFFISGLTQGFRIGFNQLPVMLKSARKNLDGALRHPEVVDEYLTAEIAHHRVAGPFIKTTVPKAHVSRFGVIPKNHNPNKWRLIVDLSHPTGHSVNDGIPKDLCGLTYITIDTAIKHILTTGPGTLLAKVDIKNAFRLLPVHPADRHMLAMKWNNQIYIDIRLPFGLSWFLESKGVSPILHYLDSFLTMGPSSSTTCQENLNIINEVCSYLGVPLALEKLEGPTQSLTFLGIVLDTSRMEMRLPEDKLSRIHAQLTIWLGKKKATKREILSLVGLLQRATKVVRSGRTFVSRMYSTASKLKELYYYTRLNKDFRSDLHWCHVFVGHWNGLSLLQGTSNENNHDYSSRQMPLGHGAVQPSSANTGFNRYGPMSGVQVP